MADDFINRGLVTKAGGQFYLPLKLDDDGRDVATDKYAELALRGKVFSASVAAVTLPVNANNLVSLFAIYNPPSSGVFLDIIEVEAHLVLATSVVNALGIYFQGPTLAGAATFTTRSNAIQNARLSEGPAPSGQFYTALTHSGTPLLKDLVGGWGAVTDGGSTPIRKSFGGKILVPPGAVVSLAMTTAAATGSSFTGVVTWAEIPYSAI